MKTEGKYKLKKTHATSTISFPVVGIGASAGGLEAYKKLLKAIPEDSGMAYVLVQHLHPGHASMLPELLQKVTVIPVIEISDDIEVQPDHIYILPSNKMLRANEGILQLTPRTKKKNEKNLPIDLFFTSLAAVHQSRSIGIVLSGTASDGTQGLKAIKDHGGITLAQNEASAAYDEMPKSAIEAGVVDFILPPDQIPQKLLEITKHFNCNGGDEESVSQTDEVIFKQILSLLRARRQMDFTYYKQTTIRRRILRRMVISKHEELADYLKYLRTDKTEQDTLYQDLLIPVTGFFRDTKTWDNLCDSVLPQLLKRKKTIGPFRIWSVGCSTGEEAYSIAMCLKEFLGDNQEKIQIFATDISEQAIAKARAGIYTKADVEAVSEQRLSEFFTKNNDGYQVNKQARKMCVFAVHNFLKDPPFGKMDLIICRNVLIYLEPYLQKKALTTFHYALSPKGSLLLGKSETISTVSELFDTALKNEKLFIRKDGSGKVVPQTFHQSEENLRFNTSGGKFVRTDFQKTADDIILSKYTPAGVVVNEGMDIVHFRGKTGAYLEQSSGIPTLNLIKLAKKGLGFELRNTLRKAKKDNAPVTKENIPVQGNDLSPEKGQRIISIEAVPLPNMAEPHYLVLFHERPPTAKLKSVTKIKRDNKDQRIQQLERELAQAREDMRGITEDQEAANEELQSTNEELLSSSEELQSLNEEIETTKEELQSTNEELTVVNQELTNLNEQATAARNYAEAIISTVREPLIVLDKNLRIKSANQSFYKTFYLKEQQTIGSLLYELADKQWDIPELRNLLISILPRKKRLVDFEVTHNFHHSGPRTMLFNAREIVNGPNEEKLILLAIEDITTRKETEQEGSVLATIVNSSDDAIISKTLDGFITTWNKGAEKIFGYSREKAVGRHISMLIPPEMEQEEQMVINKIKKGEQVLHFDTIRLTKEGRRINISLTVSPVKDKKGNITGASKIAQDITQRKQAEEILRNNEDRFRQLVKDLPAAVYSCDAQGYITFYNNAAVKVWGREPEFGKDKWCGSWKMIKPDGSALPADVCPMAIAFKEGRAIAGEEISVERPDGTRSIVRVYPQPVFGLSGEIIGAINMVIDVTEQKEAARKMEESEKNFRQLAELMPEKVSNADAAGNIIYYNQNWLSYTGFTFEELKGPGWEKVIHPDDLQELTKRWLHSIETGNDFEMEHRILNSGGEYKWHLTRSTSVKDERGKITKWIATTTEIQKIKEEEQRKGDFIKMVSHELKTPITSMKGYVQLSLRTIEEQETQFPSPIKSSLVRVDKQIVRLTRLITEMLDLSRIEAGRLELENQLFNINQLVMEAIEDFRYTSPKHNIKVSHDFNCAIYGDKNRIEQVVINLLANAIKYSPNRDTIEVLIYEADNEQVAVSIKDYGIGIDQKDHQKIFERFYRVEGNVEQTFSGFGIGLFIVKAIIERHSGFITIDSEKGKGSTFTFTLPVAHA